MNERPQTASRSEQAIPRLEPLSGPLFALGVFGLMGVTLAAQLIPDRRESLLGGVLANGLLLLTIPLGWAAIWTGRRRAASERGAPLVRASWAPSAAAAASGALAWLALRDWGLPALLKAVAVAFLVWLLLDCPDMQRTRATDSGEPGRGGTAQRRSEARLFRVLVVAALASFLVPVATIPFGRDTLGWLRFAAAGFALLVLPGYSVSLLVFRAGALGVADRIAWTLGLSLAVVPLLIYAALWVGLPLTPWLVYLAAVLLTLPGFLRSALARA